MSEAGVASRRAAEGLIRAGRVSVDGKVIQILGTKVSREADIRVDGRALATNELATVVLHKPAQFMTTMADPIFT